MGAVLRLETEAISSAVGSRSGRGQSGAGRGGRDLGHSTTAKGGLRRLRSFVIFEGTANCIVHT